MAKQPYAKPPVRTSRAAQARRPVPVARKAATVQRESVAYRIAWWSLVALVFLVPVAMGNFTWLAKLGFTPAQLPITYDQFDIVKVFVQRVLGIVALAAWSWDLLARGGKIRRTPVDWLILAFLAWVAITTVTSISPQTALFGKYRRFEGLLSFINYAVIYFLVLQFADRPSRVKTLLKSLFFSSVIVAGYGVLQYAGLDPISWGSLPFEANRAFSTFGNPDLLGGFLMFSLPVALGLALAEEDLAWRLAYWAGFGLNVVCWIAAFTRGAWIGGAVGLVIVGIIAWRHSAKLKAVDWVPMGIVTAIAGAIVAVSLRSTNEVMNFALRFKSILNLDTGSGLTRTEIWSAALDAIKARPIFGWGADTFRLVFPKFKPAAYTKDAGYLSVADNVHNYPLQLAAGIGIIGVLLLYGIFAWAAVRSAKTVFKRSDDPRHILLGACWAAAGAFLVQLMFGISVTGSAFLLWVMIAIVLVPSATTIEVKAPNWGIALGVVISVAAIMGVSYQFVVMSADHSYMMSRIYYAKGSVERTAAAQKAVDLNPSNDMYRAEVGLAYVDEFISSVQAAITAQQSGDTATVTTQVGKANTAFSSAETKLKETIAMFPDEYDNYVFLSNLYVLGGQVFGDDGFYTSAVEIADKGIAIEKYGPAVRVQRSRALLGLGRTDEAITELKYCIQLDPAYAEPSTLLAQVYESQGNFAEALKVLRALSLANPTADVADQISSLESSVTTTP
ncbi:MAG: tetratricopeptide repeat protein [Coriobacteriia bacterium]|nr:tetratricopeptide repeat protein [Coriobacteriia bacterium]